MAGQGAAEQGPGPSPRPRRPLLREDLSEAVISSADDPAARADLAHSTAATVLAAGREGAADPASLVALDDIVGLDELAQLWRHAEPATLPATLWALYLLRAWCHRHGDAVARLYRDGRRHAEVADAIAGVPDSPDAADMARLADALLVDVFRGDLATSLERAAAFSRILAAGRAESESALSPPAPAPVSPVDFSPTGREPSELELGARALEVARHLERAAEAWRGGTLH